MHRISSYGARGPWPALALLATWLVAGPTQAHETDLFCPAGAAVFADDKLQVKQGTIHGGPARDWAHVGTNRDAKLSGASTIYGDIVAGGKVKLSKEAVVTGSVVEHAAPVVLEEVHALVAAHTTHHLNHALGLTAQGHDPFQAPMELELSDGDSLFLPAGDYYLTKLKLSKGANLVLGGPVRIYMPEGKIYVKYGSSILGGAPGASLLVVMAGKGGIKISKSSRVHAGIYAPHAKLYLKYASHLHGGVVVDKLKVSKGSEIHATDVCGGALPELPLEPEPLPDFDPDFDELDDLEGD